MPSKSRAKAKGKALAKRKPRETTVTPAASEVRGLTVDQATVKIVRTARGEFPVVSIGDLVPYERQVRVHNPRNVGTIEESIKRNGAVRSIAIDERLQILAGQGTVEAAAAAGVEHVLIIPADGSVLVAVQRPNLTEAQKFDAAVSDNRAAELATGWDVPKLQAHMTEFQVPEERYFYRGELPEFVRTDEPEPADIQGPTGTTNRDVEDELRRILDAGEQIVANLPLNGANDSVAEAWLREHGRLVFAELRARLKTTRGANELDEATS